MRSSPRPKTNARSSSWSGHVAGPWARTLDFQKYQIDPVRSRQCPVAHLCDHGDCGVWFGGECLMALPLRVVNRTRCPPHSVQTPTAGPLDTAGESTITTGMSRLQPEPSTIWPTAVFCTSISREEYIVERAASDSTSSTLLT